MPCFGVWEWDFVFQYAILLYIVFTNSTNHLAFSHPSVIIKVPKIIVTYIGKITQSEVAEISSKS